MKRCTEEEAARRWPKLMASLAAIKALEKCALGFEKHAQLWRASAERTCLIEDRLRADSAEALAEFARRARAALAGAARDGRDGTARGETRQSGGSDSERNAQPPSPSKDIS